MKILKRHIHLYHWAGICAYTRDTLTLGRWRERSIRTILIITNDIYFYFRNFKLQIKNEIIVISVNCNVVALEFHKL